MTEPGGVLPLALLGLTVLLLLALPCAAILRWKKRTGGSLWVVAAGALGFFLFVTLLEGAAHRLLFAGPRRLWLLARPWRFALYGCAMAGIFEECGRYLLFRTLLKKQRDPSAALGAGLGHGCLEVLLHTALPLAACLAVGLLYRQGGEGAAAQAGPLYRTALGFTFWQGFFTLAERILAVVLHVSLSVVVFEAARENRPTRLLEAILLHGLADVPAALYQYGLIGLGLTELLFFLLVLRGTVPAARAAWARLHRPPDAQRQFEL